MSDALTPAIAVLGDSFSEEDFVIECDGCTACCRGHHGVKLYEDEVDQYDAYKDPRGEWRVAQPDGACVYLGELEDGTEGCTIHDYAPKRCQKFDCRAAVVFLSRQGMDEMVAKGELPLSVVEMGRKKLGEWNDQMNVRALSGGADLSVLMEEDDAPT